MRTRYKVVILLFTVTLALGTVILLHSSDNDEALRRFRSLFSKQSVRNLPDTLTAIGDETSLWYGGMSLLALIMMGVAFTMARGGGLQARKERLTDLEAAKAEAESLLQDGAWKEKHLRQAKDSAVRDLETSARRVYALENELSEKEKLLKNRDGELLTLRSQVSALTDRPSEMAPAKAEEEGVLREELKRKTDLLRVKDAAIKELQERLGTRGRALEGQLTEKEELLKTRDAELETVRSELNTVAGRLAGLGSAKQQAEGSLQEELRKQAEALAAKDSLMSELRENATKKIDALESQLKERERLLKSRDGEREALRSEINSLKARLHESEAAKERGEGLLQTELAKAKRASQANDSTIKDKEPEESLSRVQDLESLLSEKEKLLKARDGRIEKLEAELKEKRTQLARHEIEVRQSIERRGIWKRRLAHLGITLKD